MMNFNKLPPAAMLAGLAALLLPAVSTPSWLIGGPAAAADIETADRFFDQRKWPEAAESYRAVIRDDASNGQAWSGLGRALFRMKRYNDAIGALEKAEQLAVTPPRTRYNLARACALAGRPDAAFGWLDKSIEAGFQGYGFMKGDDKLDSLRSDPRFATALKRAERIAFPCRGDEAFREFDFWVGEWEVTVPGGGVAGTNRIEKTVDGCLLLENWSSATGGSGKSLNYRDPTSGRWRQLWIDSGGEVISAEGGLEDGAMRLIGTHTLKSGEIRPFRMTYTPLPNRHVHQLLEESTDDGESWSIWFDGDYAPR
jgi:hypothetical protein